MSDGNIDSLNIQISADAQRASRALDRLSSSLLGMDKAVKRLSGSGFGKISKNINSFSNSISKLDGIQVPDLSKAVQSLEKLGNIKVSDNGINKTVNSLNRLFKTDFSKFNAKDFERITLSISALSNMPDVSSGVNRFISSVARLANAGEKTGQSASSLKNLGRNLKDITKTFSRIKNIAPEVNTFVSSIARLANAGGKTGQTAAGLKDLADKTLDFFKTMQNAPKISENTLRMTEALAKLASAGGRVGTATGSISSAFTKLSNISTKAGNLVRKATSKITSAIKSIGNSKLHLDKASSGFANLFKSVLPLLGIRQIFSWAKDAATLGSNIAEVENVVDVSFGSMADKAYEFAATAKEQFGLSELAAKNYAGTLMAMLNSSGVAQDAAADMSTTLAGLAGDLASFYNISTDDAFYKIRAGISGETEPLKQLGINMNIVNLEAYAMSQGITKAYQEMSLAEQSMLRYNYIMAVTGAQQGDFARTSGSFANQLRLLTLNFQTLGATIGQGFIAAVLPAIQALNALMAVLQRAAEAFRNFMYVLTGYEGTGSQGGVVNEFAGLEDIGSAGGIAADGLDDATSSAKDLKKALSVLSFDELNQLSDTSVPGSDSSGSGSGGGIGSAGGLGDLGGLTDAFGKSELPDAINEWAKRIRKAFLAHDWDKLGEEIAWGLNKGLQFVYDAIKWENVGPKITAFTTAFTQTFNSLIDHLDWDLLGRTVGAGINTLVNTFNLLTDPATGVNFKQIGEKLVVGLRGAIDEIQWTNLGNAIGNYFMIAWNMLSGFVTQMSQEDGAGITGWAALGTSLGQAVNGVFEKIDFGTIGLTLANGFNGAFEALRNFTQTVRWDDLAVNLYTGLNNMIHTIDWAAAGQTLSMFVTDLLGTFVKVVQNTDWEGFGRGIGDFLSNIDWLTIFTQVTTIIWEILSGLISGLGETTAGKIVLIIAGIAALFKGSKIAMAVTEGVAKILQFWGLLPAGLEGKNPLISGAISKLGPILAKVGGFAKTAISTAVGKIGELANGIIGKIPSIGSAIGQVGTKLMTLVPKAGSMVTGAVGKLGGLIAAIGPAGWIAIGIGAGVVAIIANWDKVKEAAGKVKDFVSEKWNQLMDFLSGIPGKIGDIVGDIVDWFESLPGKIGYAIGFAAGKIASWAIDLKNIVVEKVPQIIESAVSFFAELPEKIWNAIVSAGTRIKEWATNLYNIVTEEIPKIPEKVVEFFSSLPEKIKEIGENLITGFLEGIQSLWSDVKEGVGDFVDGVIRGFTEGFDTHSPSRITEGIGENVGKGLINGIDSQSSGALTTVQGMADQIIDRMSAAMNGITDNIDRTMRNLQYTLDDAQRNANNSAWNIQSAFSNLYIPLPHIDWSWNNIDFGAFSFSIPSFSINWYKTGGLFTKATVAGIGEAGNEAVLPLENKRTMSMIANSILDNATGGMGLSKEEMRQAVTEGVVMAMMNNSQNQQPITVYAELKTESDEVLARAVTRGQKKIDYRMNPVGQF